MKSECELILACENTPVFPGGVNALNKFISSSAKYPKELYDRCIEGKVFIQFIIDTTGAIIKPEVIRGIDPKLDSIAISIVRAMPKWEPAIQNGKPVSMKFVLPIKYSFENKNQK